MFADQLVQEVTYCVELHFADRGTRFLLGQHPLADLAPRDVVAKAIMRRMRETSTEHMWLDARDFGTQKWEHRFPTILATCRAHGVDPVTELIPVAPACHYASGGVATDLHGQSSVPGLFACGEVACSGVHGANRLASNSLLEGLVFSRRIAARLTAGLPEGRRPALDGRDASLLPGSARGSTTLNTAPPDVNSTQGSATTTLSIPWCPLSRATPRNFSTSAASGAPAASASAAASRTNWK